LNEENEVASVKVKNTKRKIEALKNII